MVIKGINPNLTPIVEYVIENGEITNTEVQKLLKVSKRTASRYLNELEKHFLKRMGETGVGTVYVFKGQTNVRK